MITSSLTSRVLPAASSLITMCKRPRAPDKQHGAFRPGARVVSLFLVELAAVLPEVARAQQGGVSPCADDPTGDLAAAGATCAQLLPMGCSFDVAAVDKRVPTGTIVAVFCPMSCNACVNASSGNVTTRLDAFAFPWPPPGYHFAPDGRDCSGWVGGATAEAVTSVLGHPSSEHFYNFTVQSARSYTFDSSSSSFVTLISVKSLDLRQQFAGCDRCSSQCSSGRHGRGSVLRDVWLQPGQYALVVEGAGTKHGVYHVSVSPSLCMSHLVDNTCHDDKGGFLAVQGQTCRTLLFDNNLAVMGSSTRAERADYRIFGKLTCDTDLSILFASAPKGSTVATVCPESCTTPPATYFCQDLPACKDCPACRVVARTGWCNTALGSRCCRSCPGNFGTNGAPLVVPHCKFELGKASSNASIRVKGANNPAECAKKVHDLYPTATGASWALFPNRVQFPGSVAADSMPMCMAEIGPLKGVTRVNFNWQTCTLHGRCAPLQSAAPAPSAPAPASPLTCRDDFMGLLASAQMTCQRLMTFGFGCDKDLHYMDPANTPKGWLVKFVCPKMCQACYNCNKPPAACKPALAPVRGGAACCSCGKSSGAPCPKACETVAPECSGAMQCPTVCAKSDSACKDDAGGMLAGMNTGCTSLKPFFDCNQDLAQVFDVAPGAFMHLLCPHTCKTCPQHAATTCKSPALVCEDDDVGLSMNTGGQLTSCDLVRRANLCEEIEWYGGSLQCCHSCAAKSCDIPSGTAMSQNVACSTQESNSALAWLQNHGQHRHNPCMDKDHQLPQGYTCASIAATCSCHDISRAADACCQSCPAQANPVRQCGCVDNLSSLGHEVRDSIFPTNPDSCKSLFHDMFEGVEVYRSHVTYTDANFLLKADNACSLLPSLGMACCKTCRLVSKAMISAAGSAVSKTCRDESPTELKLWLDNHVGLLTVAALSPSTGDNLTCSSIIEHGMCDLFPIWFASYFPQLGITMGVVQHYCASELQACRAAAGCEQTLMDLLSKDAIWRDRITSSSSSNIRAFGQCLQTGSSDYGPGAGASDSLYSSFYSSKPPAAAKFLPCRAACTACDLPEQCESLLMRPLRGWTIDIVARELIPFGPLVVAAFSTASVDGLRLSSIASQGLPSDLEQAIPQNTVEPLVEWIKKRASPQMLELPPNPLSCSRLQHPIIVEHNVTFAQVYSVNDLTQEFTASIVTQTSWPEDRVQYIPTRSKEQLRSCRRLCLDLSKTNIKGANPPSEASKCCDSVSAHCCVFQRRARPSAATDSS